jgi:hypothetical protein
MRPDCTENTVQSGSHFQTEGTHCLADAIRSGSCSEVEVEQHWALEGNRTLESQPEGWEGTGVVVLMGEYSRLGTAIDVRYWFLLAGRTCVILHGRAYASPGLFLLKKETDEVAVHHS